MDRRRARMRPEIPRHTSFINQTMAMMVTSYEWSPYASHRQFYLEDGVNPGDPGATGFWSTEAHDDRLAMGPGIVGIVTGSFGTVRVRLELHDGEPPLDPGAWDHVVEGSIDLPSGRLRVAGCLDDASMEAPVRAGEHRVRCYQANLADGVEYGEGPDRYLVQIWHAPSAARRVLKRWSEEESNRGGPPREPGATIA